MKKNRPQIGLYLKQRDAEVVETLLRYRIMRESTLHRLCFPTVKHRRKVQARLKQLREAGYIRRPDPRRARHNADTSPDPPYWVDRLGVEELLNGHALDDGQKERVRVSKNLSQWKAHRLKHPLDLSEVRACLELAVEQTPGVSLPDWYDEHDKNEQGPILHTKVKIPYGDTGRERPFTLCADVCFVLENAEGDKQDFFFVEIDEGTESARKRWGAQKVPAYLAYAEQGFEEDFDFPGEDFRVLTICRSQGDKDHAKRKQTLLKTAFNAGGRGRFWFATFDEVMPGDTVTGEHFLAGKIWQRARKEEIENKTELALCDHLFL